MRRKHVGEAVEAQQIKFETVHAPSIPPASSHARERGRVQTRKARTPRGRHVLARAHAHTHTPKRTRNRAPTRARSLSYIDVEQSILGDLDAIQAKL